MKEMTLGEKMDLVEVILNGILSSYYVVGFTDTGESVNLIKADNDGERQQLITALTFASENCLTVLGANATIFYAENSQPYEEVVEEDEKLPWDDDEDEDDQWNR